MLCPRPSIAAPSLGRVELLSHRAPPVVRSALPITKKLRFSQAPPRRLLMHRRCELRYPYSGKQVSTRYRANGAHSRCSVSPWLLPVHGARAVRYHTSRLSDIGEPIPTRSSTSFVTGRGIMKQRVQPEEPSVAPQAAKTRRSPILPITLPSAGHAGHHARWAASAAGAGRSPNEIGPVRRMLIHRCRPRVCTLHAGSEIAIATLRARRSSSFHRPSARLEALPT